MSPVLEELERQNQLRKSDGDHFFVLCAEGSKTRPWCARVFSFPQEWSRYNMSDFRACYCQAISIVNQHISGRLTLTVFVEFGVKKWDICICEEAVRVQVHVLKHFGAHHGGVLVALRPVPYKRFLGDQSVCWV